MSEGYSVQEPIAVWSSARGVWETSQVSMLCGHSVPFLETWPTRGMTRNGKAYALPTSGHRMAGSGSSSSQQELLRTPTAVEAEGGLVHPEKARRENRTVRLGAQILEMTGDLLPTPVAQPSGNTPEDHLRKKPGRTQVTDLAIIVENDLLKTGGALLPTPNTMEHLPAREGEARERQLRRGDVNGSRRQSMGNLREDILEVGTEWGKYEPAIHRWGAVLGREAPAPTQVSRRGKPQLAPAFVEWMMGLEKGWVTDPEIGLTRNEQLRMLGNGVVPQQAFAALKLMKGNHEGH